jgi:Zn-dependent peptidase ImmA (M78 family)
MTYNISKFQHSEQSLLKALRRLVPERPLEFEEAKQIAELQANRLRQLLRLDEPAFPHEAIMEMPRIEVAFDLDLPVSGSAHWNGNAWVIVLNGLEGQARQRFSLAHEFKHILDHTTKQFLYRDTLTMSAHEQAEQVADYFAGCLLMPTMQLKRLFYRGIQKPTELAAHFQVSARAVQYRLRQTGIAERAKRCNSLYQSRGNMSYNRRAMARVTV